MVLDKLGKNLDNMFRKIRGLPKIDKEAINALLQDLQRSLLQADVKVDLVFELTENVKKRAFDKDINEQLRRKDYIIKILHDELVHLLGGKKAKKRVKPGKTTVILMVGIQGSGKTTTVGKLAFQYKKKGYKIGVINTDTWRPGAYDQLKQVVESIPGEDIAYYGMENEKNPLKIARRGLTKFTKRGNKKDVILVDTAGRHKQEEDLMKEMKKLEKIIKPNETILVIDGTLGQQAYSQAKAFASTTNVGSIVITKLDGSAKGGGALAAAAACGAPIRFIGVGEHTEDLDRFKPTKFVGTLLGIPDIEGLVKKVEELGIEPSEDQVKRMMKGKFTLEDLYEQLKAINSRGMFRKIIGMMGGKNIPKEFKDMAQSNLKKWRVVIDSCTDEEKVNPRIIRRTRIKRIARGSGSTYTEIKKMLQQYNQMQKMMKNMMGMQKKRGRGAPGQQGGMPGMGGIPGMGGMNMEEMAKMMGKTKKKNKKHPW